MSQAGYLRDLNAIGRGYWLGVFSQDQFYDLMFNSIDRWLTRAWQEGAKSVGIDPGEITPKEQMQLSAIIFREYSFVPNLANFIYANRKGKGLLGSVLQRMTTWANRYTDVSNRAKVAAESDPKLKWTIGPTTDHCGTCAKLNGKIKRASWWDEHVMPQMPPNPNLECKGWKCLCELIPTTEPMSRGRMPGVP